MDSQGGSQEQSENDYVMKCIMRVLTVIGTDMLTALEMVANKLTNVLVRVCKNPVNPQFNHYLFESIAVMIRTGCDASAAAGLLAVPAVTANIEKFEILLLPSFQMVLAQDVSEFIPYVFQILAQILYFRQPEASGVRGTLSPAYKAMLPPLLSPVLWERKGNIPALMDLFQAYIMKGMKDIVGGGLLMGVLGIFQKLLSAKVLCSFVD